MKTALLFSLLAFSVSSFAQQTQEIKITGPAAEEIQQLLAGHQTENLRCSSQIIPACPVCDGGPTVTTCVLKVKSAEKAQ